MRRTKTLGSWMLTLVLTFAAVSGILTVSNHYRTPTPVTASTATSTIASTTASTTASTAAATTPLTTIVFHPGDDGSFRGTTSATYSDN